jgi:hypothetical protein
MIKQGTKWAGTEGKEFIVIHVIEQAGHIWVHYRENLRDEPREYSCYLESFLSRFRQLPE